MNYKSNTGTNKHMKESAKYNELQEQYGCKQAHERSQPSTVNYKSNTGANKHMK